MVNNEEVLRPGQIQFFFQHTLTDNKEEYRHYFAFVRWYRFTSRPGIDRLASHTTAFTSTWRNTFEDMSEDCILPVQRLHLKVGIKFDFAGSINIITYAEPVIF